MRKRAVKLNVVLLVVAAFIVAGCGSSGGDSLTKAEFTKMANTICSKWQAARDERYAAARSKFAPLKSNASKEKAIRYVLSPYETAVHSLGQLQPPAGEEEKVETFIRAMEEETSQVKTEPLLATKKPIFQKSNELVESYGLAKCTV